MLARRSSITTGINLRGLPLLAVAVSLHYLPICLCSTAVLSQIQLQKYLEQY